MEVPPNAPPARNALSILGLLRPHWASMSVALGAAGGEAVAALLEPWPLKIVLDYLLQARPLPGWMMPVIGWIGDGKLAVLNVAVISVAVIAVAGAVSGYLNTYLTTNVGQRVMHDLRRTLYHHIHRLSLAEHDEKRTGDLIGRVTSDIESIQDFVTAALLGIVTSALTLVGILAVMLYLNWRFTLISLSVAPVLFLVVYVFTRRIKKASRDVRKKESELLSLVEEVFSSIRVVKAFAREDYEERRFERQSLDNVEATLLARAIKMKLSPVVEIIVAIGTCLMLWYGARLVLAGGLTAGALVVFLLYLGKMYKPMRDLSKMTDTVSKASVAFERIREVLETEAGVRDLPHARRAPRFKGAIAFDHVSFAYTPDQPILTDVSFAIEPGQVAAFVGPTGGGKTTIINLIARFYDPVSGTITIDGTDIRRVTMRSLRDQISFVLQDTLLFRASIWENIAYGRPEANRAEIVHAAELANAHEFITEMPEGYDTLVGERGVTLSGGQRQRIAIARAVIRNTPILVLDEPTSGLDAQSEQAVFEALDRLMKDKTSIVIAHHLATIVRADTIFVVKDAQLAERGTHDELLAAGGFYAELCNIQFGESAPALA
jgi:subfamily B ATP-binding cassette protein MsbA